MNVKVSLTFLFTKAILIVNAAIAIKIICHLIVSAIQKPLKIFLATKAKVTPQINVISGIKYPALTKIIDKTVNKVIDLLCPYVKGGKVGLFVERAGELRCVARLSD